MIELIGLGVTIVIVLLIVAKKIISKIDENIEISLDNSQRLEQIETSIDGNDLEHNFFDGKTTDKQNQLFLDVYNQLSEEEKRDFLKRIKEPK